MGYIIKSKKLYTEKGAIYNTELSVDGNIIKEIGNVKGGNGYETIDIKDCMLLPGLIDIHVHGGGGFDIMDASYEAVNAISVHKAKEGVTSFCPTTVTASLDITYEALKSITEAMEKGVKGADIIGPFIEGPYINKAYKGAHPEDKIRPVDLDEIKGIVALCKGKISFAIAPELENALEVIKYLSGQGVNVRIGHSGADYKCALEAFSAGASMDIHTYNAMSPLTHRAPGLVGAAMNNDGIYAELIFDGAHVDAAPGRILAKVKPEGKLVLVTDCMRAGGLDDGMYTLGEMDVVVKDSVARTMDGNLAGSTLTLNRAVRNMHEWCGFDITSCVNMASINPAKALGLTDRGSIEEGKRADLIAVDDKFNVKFVMINGDIVINNL